MSEGLIEQMTAEAEATAAAPVETVVEAVVPVEVAVPVEVVAEQVEGQDAFTEEDREALSKALKAERKRARDLEKQVKEFQASVSESSQADMGEQERLVAEAVATARAEAKAEFDAQILKARVEAKAAGMNFHDPALALGLIELESDATDDELVDALKELAGDRPYLVKSAVPKMDMGVRPTKEGAVGAVSNDEWFRDFLSGRNK